MAADAPPGIGIRWALLCFLAAGWGCSAAPPAGQAPPGIEAPSGTETPSGSMPPPAGEIHFAGNVKITEAELRAALEESIERLNRNGFRKADADDLAYDVESYYRRRGHHFSRVHYLYSPRRADIRIEEGPLVVIRDIRFEGNTIFSADELRALLNAEKAGFLGMGKQIFVLGEIGILQGAIEGRYKELGFQEVHLQPPALRFDPDRAGVVISMRIDEGRQHVLEKIDIIDAPADDLEALSKRLERWIGSAYAPRLKYEIRSAVEEHFAERGHPDAEASVTESRLPEQPAASRLGLKLLVAVRPGPAVRIRSIQVEGNRKTHTDFIEGRLTVQEGEPYDSARIGKSFRRLFATTLFKSVNLKLGPTAPGQEGSEEERDLLVQVVEGPSSEFFFELGYGSYDLARARAGVREKNLFGRGLIGRAEALGSIRGGQGTIGITDPWLFRSDWSADLPISFLYREEPAFTIHEEKIGLRLARPILTGVQIGGAYRFSFSHIEDFDVEEQAGEEPNLFLGAAGPFLEYDSRDDIFIPTRGSRSRLYSEIGTPYLGGEITFVHSGFLMNQFFELFEGTVLAGTVQTDWIIPFAGTERIPIQERLFNGGENSVRSFKQSDLGPKDDHNKPVGGEVRNLGSLELRQRLFGSLFLAVFGDYGNVAVRSGKPFEDFRPGAGAGLRYGLPIGPVRLDAAFNPDRRHGEDFFNIHFAVGMPY